MSWERFGGMRAAIAQLAAQIMYGEGVKQYFTAKRIAARRLAGRERDLPSNGEIKEALLDLVIEIEGEGRTKRLFAMRIVALEALDALAPFHPRLIGSVATGHVRNGSDVDIQVFAWDIGGVELHLEGLGWTFDTERVTIRKSDGIHNYTHFHVADVFPIELTVYPPSDLAHRPRSSTDGKPIIRIRDAKLRKICETEHFELWQRYLHDGSTPTMEDILAAEDLDEGPADSDGPDPGNSCAIEGED
jgi:hypothetical protein